MALVLGIKVPINSSHSSHVVGFSVDCHNVIENSGFLQVKGAFHMLSVHTEESIGFCQAFRAGAAVRHHFLGA